MRKFFCREVGNSDGQHLLVAFPSLYLFVRQNASKQPKLSKSETSHPKRRPPPSLPENTSVVPGVSTMEDNVHLLRSHMILGGYARILHAAGSGFAISAANSYMCPS